MQVVLFLSSVIVRMIFLPFLEINPVTYSSITVVYVKSCVKPFFSIVLNAISVGWQTGACACELIGIKTKNTPNMLDITFVIFVKNKSFNEVFINIFSIVKQVRPKPNKLTNINIDVKETPVLKYLIMKDYERL
jgi:hypothetical protein